MHSLDYDAVTRDISMMGDPLFVWGPDTPPLPSPVVCDALWHPSSGVDEPEVRILPVEAPAQEGSSVSGEADRPTGQRCAHIRDRIALSIEPA